MAKRRKTVKSVRNRTIPVKYDYKTSPSEEEAKSNFKVGFWRRRHKPGNKKGVDNHPGYVYGRKGEYYKYLGVTRDPKSGDRNNKPLTKNPNPTKKDAAYLRRAEEGHYRSFTEYYPDWRFDDDDYKNIVKKSKK